MEVAVGLDERLWGSPEWAKMWGVLLMLQLCLGPKIPPEHLSGHKKGDSGDKPSLPFLSTVVQTGAEIAPIGAHFSQQLPFPVPTL